VIAQRGAAHALHDDVHEAVVGAAGVDHPCDVGVVQARRDRLLPSEAGGESVVEGDLPEEHLDRQGLIPPFDAAGLVHPGHRPFGDERADAVTRQDLA